MDLRPHEPPCGCWCGVEDFGRSGFLDIDFSDTAVLITANDLQPYGYREILRFSEAKGTIPGFTVVALGPATDWAGLDASRISHVDADSIDINLTGLQGQQGQQVLLDLTAVPVDGGAGSVDDLVLGAVALYHQ